MDAVPSVMAKAADMLPTTKILEDQKKVSPEGHLVECGTEHNFE